MDRIGDEDRGRRSEGLVTAEEPVPDGTRYGQPEHSSDDAERPQPGEAGEEGEKGRRRCVERRGSCDEEKTGRDGEERYGEDEEGEDEA